MKTYFYLLGFKTIHCVFKRQTLQLRVQTTLVSLQCELSEQWKERIGYMHSAHCFPLLLSAVTCYGLFHIANNLSW